MVTQGSVLLVYDNVRLIIFPYHTILMSENCNSLVYGIYFTHPVLTLFLKRSVPRLQDSIMHHILASKFSTHEDGRMAWREVSANFLDLECYRDNRSLFSLAYHRSTVRTLRHKNLLYFRPGGFFILYIRRITNNTTFGFTAYDMKLVI